MTAPSAARQAIELRGKATQGEWVYETDHEGSSMGWISQCRDDLPLEQIAEVLGDSAQQAMNAEYLVHAANTYPAVAEALIELRAVAQRVIDEAHQIHDSNPAPQKYRAPYASLVDLIAILKEPT